MTPNLGALFKVLAHPVWLNKSAIEPASLLVLSSTSKPVHYRRSSNLRQPFLVSIDSERSRFSLGCHTHKEILLSNSNLEMEKRNDAVAVNCMHPLSCIVRDLD